MVADIKFRKTGNDFQNALNKDIERIRRSKSVFVPADKTRNLYELEPELHGKLMRDNITKTYKVAPDSAYSDINIEAKHLATSLGVADRMDTLAQSQAFVTLKDHKDGFRANLPCRLINPAKSEMGKASKRILDRISNDVRGKLNLNQWKNSNDVIEWFRSIPDKSNCTFVTFDIVEFYPSISEELLKRALDFAAGHTTVTEEERNIIFHSRKSLLFHNNTRWMKKNGQDLFDVTMGSYDGAEVYELVGTFILSQLCQKLQKQNVGLYRDDSLALLRRLSGPQTDRMRKAVTE